MGLLRFLLAISVAVGHFGGVRGFMMGPGSIEVEAFFIISGFYMAMVLQDKYRNQRALFYTNRYLRLFPTYFAVLLISLAFFALTNSHNRFGIPFTELAAIFQAGDFGTKLYIVGANLGIFGLDTSLFLTFDGRSLHFAKEFRDSSVPVYKFLLIPQGWSLGVELYFYALAPFILLSRSRMIAATVISVAIFILVLRSSLPQDPWSHRFFPAVLFMFLAGSTSWQITRNHLDRKWIRILGAFLLATCCLYLVFIRSLPISNDWDRILYLSLIAISVGPIFALTKNNRFDRSLGEFSYPIYVSHLLVFTACSTYMTGRMTSLTALILTIAFSAGLVWFVEKPLDKYRKRRTEVRRETSAHLTNKRVNAT